MYNRLVDTSIQILRLLPDSGLHTNAIIKQTSRDRTHVINAIRFLENSQLVGIKDEKNWRFGQKKIIIPSNLGFEIKMLMDDLDRYHDTYSRFRQIQEEFEDVADPYQFQKKFLNEDSLSVVYHSQEYKVKDEIEANDLIKKREDVIRNKLKSKGWTDEEVELRDSVSDGLNSVKRFCDNNIFSALVHRYTFIFYRFDLNKNEIVRNILTEVIVNEFRRQFIEPVSRMSKNFQEDGIDKDRIYSDMFNQIADPILTDFGYLLGIKREDEDEEDEELYEVQVYNSLLSNRFVYPAVKNLIISFLRLLQHYRDGNTTQLIDVMRILHRLNIMNSIETIDNLLGSQGELDVKKKLQLVVSKEHDSILERFFRKDNEGIQDSKVLAELLRRFTTPDGI
ncbi:MAG: hypothetical protein WAK50_01820 [Nitrososphaeraceae archaeon]|jgi:hypothetical protein